MESEPFIMSSIARAQAWVDACSRSIGIPAADSAAMLASLTGFGSWDLMVYAIDNMPPSTVDESVDEQTRKSRQMWYVHILWQEFEVDPRLGLTIATKLSPSSSAEFGEFNKEQIISVEGARIAFLNAITGDEADSLSPNQIGGDDDPFCGEPDPERLVMVVTLCGRVLPEAYADFFDELGWDAEVNPDLPCMPGSPSIYVEDLELGTIPVYLSAATHKAFNDYPIDYDFELKACIGDFLLNHDDAPVMLFMNRWPQFKYIGSRPLSLLGIAFYADDLTCKPLLFTTECDSINALLRINSQCTDINCGEISTIDHGQELLHMACVHMSEVLDFGDSTKYEVVEALDTETGWSVVRYLDIRGLDE